MFFQRECCQKLTPDIQYAIYRKNLNRVIMEEIESLERTSVREKAYILLRNWIVKGKLAPNQKLKDKELADKLGVSRTPIREALLRLEDEGLVQTKPSNSTQVTPIDFHNALNLYSIVWTLEGLALRQAFDVLTEENIQAMKAANEKFLQALQNNEPFLAVEADNDFHSVYLLASKNLDLCQMLSVVKQKISRLKIYYFNEVKDSFLSYQEHHAIIEALQKRNFLMALEAVEHNWKASHLRIQSQDKS